MSRNWQNPCLCAVCKAKARLEDVRMVDTDAYHGTGQIESLAFKLDYLIEAVTEIVKPLRCERGSDDEEPDDDDT